MTPAGVEPAITWMKARCPRPLDEGAIYALRQKVFYQQIFLISIFLFSSLYNYPVIYIFHGDNLEASRNAALDQTKEKDILHFDQKEVDPEKINLLLNSTDLFGHQKTLFLSNFLSVSKPIFEKTVKLINSSKFDVYIWQDKALTIAQLKPFPKAKINLFRADNILYACLNDIKPKNLIVFSPKYDKVIEKGLYDLFLYLLKGNIRRQLQTFSKFNSEQLKKTYLYLIELDYQNKSGQLSIPKEIALKRIIINLLK